jgi:O-methyltransferase
MFMKKLVLKTIEKFGYSLQKVDNQTNSFPDIIETEFWEIYNFCKPYTMTSVERMYGLYSSVNYILSKGIEGDFVECGVWRGGCAMLVAKMLSNRNLFNRKIFLYDTFEGMSQPTDSDLSINGEEANSLFETIVNEKGESTWCLADLDDVRNNLKITNFPDSNLVFVKGKVEDTLPSNVPEGKIAILRLDTDWYESTKHELNILFPMLSENGVLIIDDYGHWQGCRKAVDEYIKENNLPLLLNRIDYTCRSAVKNFC